MNPRIQHALAVAAIATLLVASGASWLSPHAASAGPRTLPRATAATARPTAPADTPDLDDDGAPLSKKAVAGKLNLNTATVDQLMLLPGIGPSKAERVVAWRTRHGPFKRIADLRKVKGFGYKTVKKLEGNLDVKGDSTLRPGS
jgi:competence protein ComEA